MVLPIAFAPAMLPPRAGPAERALQRRLGARRRRQGRARHVVDDLRVDVRRRCGTRVSRGRSALPRDPLALPSLDALSRRSLRRLDLSLADATSPPSCRPSSSALRRCSGRPSACTDRACAGGGCSPRPGRPLTIDAGHGDVRLLVDRDVDPGRDVEDHRVRVAEREHDLLALQLRAVADADDVEVLAEAFGDAAAPRWRRGCARGRGTCRARGSSRSVRACS